MVNHWQEVHGRYNLMGSDGFNCFSYIHHNVIVNTDNLCTLLLMHGWLRLAGSRGWKVDQKTRDP